MYVYVHIIYAEMEWPSCRLWHRVLSNFGDTKGCQTVNLHNTSNESEAVRLMTFSSQGKTCPQSRCFFETGGLSQQGIKHYFIKNVLSLFQHLNKTNTVLLAMLHCVCNYTLIIQIQDISMDHKISLSTICTIIIWVTHIHIFIYTMIYNDTYMWQ